MKKCSFENLLLPYLQHELDDSDHAHIAEHIATCDYCQQLLAELQMVDTALSNYERQPAPTDIYSAYEKQLAHHFQPEPAWKTTGRAVGSFISSLFISNSASFRVARACAILIIGVFVGRAIFMPAPEPPIQRLQALSESTLSEQDIQFISNYIVQSELLLLTIANAASNEPTVDDITFNKDMAQTLLYKTAQVQRKAEALDDDVIVTFLNHLELVLLEISNRDADEIRDAFDNIKEIVNEADMVQKSRRLQRRLEQSLQDA